MFHFHPYHQSMGHGANGNAHRAARHPLSIGAAVVAHSLQQRTELNGKRGRVIGQQGQRVLVDFGEAFGGSKALRPETLRRVWGFCHTCHAQPPRGRQIFPGLVTRASDHVPCKLSPSGDLQCSNCGGSFVEEIDNEQDLAEARGGRHPEQGSASGFSQGFAHPQANPFGSMFFGPDMWQGMGPFGGFDFDAMQQQWAELASQQQAQQHTGPPPAAASAVAALEQKKIDAECAQQLSDSPCVVCQDVFQEGEEMTRMPCGHHFHSSCITPWLQEHNSCPTCRHELPTDDAAYESAKRQHANGQ